MHLTDHTAAGTRGRLGFAALALLAVGALGLSVPADAQQRADIIPLSTFTDPTTGAPMPASMSPRRSGFDLFAEEDIAGTSLRMSGRLRYPPINAGGICPFANTSGDIFNTQCGVFNGTSTFFHMTAAWGTGLTGYRAIRDVYPGVADMRAPVGYGTPWRITSIAPVVQRLGAADGQFGRLYAGVTSANGEGCRDFQGVAGAGLPANFTLTASLDCPETWAGGGFDGIRAVPDSVWAQRFAASPTTFQWEDWRIPRAQYTTFDFLGTNSSYGAFSDFPREVLQRLGAVTPKGAGPAGDRGFPLGLTIRYDAWKFDRPSVRDGAFIRWLVINESAKVWGQGVDYDEIYMGVDPGVSTGGQRPAVYNIISKGVWTISAGGYSGQCNTTSYPRRIPPGANEGCDGNAGMAFRFLMFLKSPLGDLRNKQFSDPASPFYSPTHPDADDTITFNHYRQGGFNIGDQLAWRRSDRAVYGWMAGKEEEFLDGRSVADLAATGGANPAGRLWHLFLYEGTDGTVSPTNARWNRSVPSDIQGYGSWDYNDDGIPDTIKVPDCGQFGCAKPFADTIAGGFTSDNGENIGNWLGVGPFALKAGDTTEFIFYFGGALADTVQFWTQIDNVTKQYFANYAGASAYPTPVITPQDITVNSSFFRDSVNNAQSAEVRIQLKVPRLAQDPFIKDVLNRLESPAGASLRDLNPGLLDKVRGRMNQNLAQVLVFKSCDNGVSWTSAGDCTNAVAAQQTRDEAGVGVGIGWRPRQIITVDSITGALSSSVFSETVNPGRTYLYSVVTKTRSMKDIRVVISQTVVNGVVTARTEGTLQDAIGVDVDTITSPLTASGPYTATVYAPISVPAGTRFATLDTARVQGPTGLQGMNRLNIAVRLPNIDGTYRMRFGNRFIITRTVDTVSGALTSQVVRQSVYMRGVTDPAQTPVLNFVAAADTFSSNADVVNGSQLAAGVTPTAAQAPLQFRTAPRTTVGSVKTFVDTIARAGYVLAGGANNAPLYVAFSTVSTQTAATGLQYRYRATDFIQNTGPFEGSLVYPGFHATITSETAPSVDGATGGGARARWVIRGPGDTLNTGITTANSPVFSVDRSTLYALGGYTHGGDWRITWAGDAFGPRVPFQPSTPPALQATLDASLAARPTAQTATVDESFRSLRNFLGGPTGTRPMLPAKLPFQVFGRDGQPAQVAFLQRHTSGNVTDSIFRNSRLFGNGGDTIRVQVPADLWMPGDTLWLVENMIQDSTIVVGGNSVVVARDTTVNGRVQKLPIQVSRPTLSTRLVIECASTGLTFSRFTCNPLALGTLGATGYRPMEANYVHVWRLNREFGQNDEIQLTANPINTAGSALTKTEMDRIYVVPNPYIVQGGFDRLSSGRAVLDPRIMFVNVPAEGMLRVYSVSGQLMQQLSWTQADLLAQGSRSPTGDLPFILRTREGLDFGPGLYLYVLTPKSANANGQIARGKFVIIR
jgi:hypothetical protein